METSVNVVLAHVKEKELWQLETCPNRGDYSECTAKSMYILTINVATVSVPFLFAGKHHWKHHFNVSFTNVVARSHCPQPTYECEALRNKFSPLFTLFRHCHAKIE